MPPESILFAFVLTLIFIGLSALSHVQPKDEQ